MLVEGAVVNPIVLAVTQSAASVAPIATKLSIPIVFEMLAVIVASASGVLTARENKLDLVGAVTLAVLCALGGGLLRDVILQKGDVYLLSQPLAILVSLATAIAAFIFPSVVEKPDRLIAMLDIFSVGLFSAMGADKALYYGFPTTICIVMGFITAVGGGVLRDICLARVPGIFQRGNLYALAAVAGSASYTLLLEYTDVWNIVAALIATMLTMFIRWWSIRYNILSPTEVDLARVKRVAAPIKRVAEPIARPIRRLGKKPGVSGERAQGKSILGESDD